MTYPSAVDACAMVTLIPAMSWSRHRIACWPVNASITRAEFSAQNVALALCRRSGVRTRMLDRFSVRRATVSIIRHSAFTMRTWTRRDCRLTLTATTRVAVCVRIASTIRRVSIAISVRIDSIDRTDVTGTSQRCVSSAIVTNSIRPETVRRRRAAANAVRPSRSPIVSRARTGTLDFPIADRVCAI